MITNHPIYKAVMAEVQNAEELGGVRDTTEYIQLMSAIITELATRISNATVHIEG